MKRGDSKKIDFKYIASDFGSPSRLTNILFLAFSASDQVDNSYRLASVDVGTYSIEPNLKLRNTMKYYQAWRIVIATDYSSIPQP